MPRLIWVLEHFRENIRLARGLVNGPSCPQIVGLLAGMIEERVSKSFTKRRKPELLPPFSQVRTNRAAIQPLSSQEV